MRLRRGAMRTTTPSRPRGCVAGGWRTTGPRGGRQAFVVSSWATLGVGCCAVGARVAWPGVMRGCRGLALGGRAPRATRCGLGADWGGDAETALLRSSDLDGLRCLPHGPLLDLGPAPLSLPTRVHGDRAPYLPVARLGRSFLFLGRSAPAEKQRWSPPPPSPTSWASSLPTADPMTSVVQWLGLVVALAGTYAVSNARTT